MPIERKLAAIMFTDIAGYTESMSKSESKTLNLLEKKRSILKPLLKKYKGTFVKEIGDGTLSYFESAVNAATCAVKLQEKTYEDKEMNIRVGIHIGDIVFKDGDVFGGGVNVASRLESIAPAGGVCVSKSVYDELSNQDDFDGIELGLQSLKGVGRLIEVFGLKGEKLNEPNPNEYQDNKIDKHSDDEVPSIAIIPFKNKGKKEDAFYAYGICEDLISDVSSAGLIRVASKQQIEEAGKLPIDELAKVLDVRYIANGELWRMGDMFQLSVELYDTKDKKVVWSDRWQEKWDNLPSIKGSLSDGLLKALGSKPQVENKLETTNSEAYEYYLKGKYKYNRRKDVEGAEIARGLLQKAIELDRGLITAEILLGLTYSDSGNYNKAMEIFTQSLNKATTLGNKREIGHSFIALGMIHHRKLDYDMALDYYIRSLKISEEFEDKHRINSSINNIGILYGDKGLYNEELKYLQEGLKISEELGDKLDIAITLSAIGNSYLNIGRYKESLDLNNRAISFIEDINIGRWSSYLLKNMGETKYEMGNYKEAIKSLEKAYNIRDKLKLAPFYLLPLLTLYYLVKKILEQDFDSEEINSLINKVKNTDYKTNYRLFELLEDTSYLETAYNQIQEKASAMEEDLAKKFLSYPIPKAIVEEWEKVK